MTNNNYLLFSKFRYFITFTICQSILIRQENIILSNPSKSVFLDAWHNKSVNFQTSKVLVIEFLFPIQYVILAALQLDILFFVIFSFKSIEMVVCISF